MSCGLKEDLIDVMMGLGREHREGWRKLKLKAEYTPDLEGGTLFSRRLFLPDAVLAVTSEDKLKTEWAYHICKKLQEIMRDACGVDDFPGVLKPQLGDTLVFHGKPVIDREAQLVIARLSIKRKTI